MTGLCINGGNVDKQEVLVCGKHKLAFSFSDECDICMKGLHVWLVMEDYGFGGTGVVAIYSYKDLAEKHILEKQDPMMRLQIEEWKVDK